MNEPTETFYLHLNKGHYFLERDINKCLSQKVIKVCVYDDRVEASFLNSFNEALEKHNNKRGDPFLYAAYNENNRKRPAKERNEIKRRLGI